MEFRSNERLAVAERFRALRRKALLTQARLGLNIGICRQTVSEIESQRVRLHSSTWEDFVRFELKYSDASKVELPRYFE